MESRFSFQQPHLDATGRGQRPVYLVRPKDRQPMYPLPSGLVLGEAQKKHRRSLSFWFSCPLSRDGEEAITQVNLSR